MKNFSVYLVIFLIYPLLSIGQINYRLQIDKSELKISAKDGYDIIEINIYGMTSITAEPMMPVKRLNFIIPADKKIAKIQVNNIEKEPLNESIKFIQHNRNALLTMSGLIYRILDL